jgi:hypothetical protein
VEEELELHLDLQVHKVVLLFLVQLHLLVAAVVHMLMPFLVEQEHQLLEDLEDQVEEEDIIQMQ